MSEIARKATLVGTVSSLSFGWAVLLQPDIIKQMPNKMEEKASDAIEYVSKSHFIKQIQNGIQKNTHDAIEHVCDPHVIKQTQNGTEKNIHDAIEHVCDHLGVETNKERDIKDITNNVVKKLEREIKIDVEKLNSQASRLGLDPVERSQSTEQSHQTIAGKARKQAVSWTKEENKKYRNILTETQISIVAAIAASKALKDSGILENKDNNVSEGVTTTL